jgi:omega-6 fatty acid desaturase (delta-12 desaturase)
LTPPVSLPARAAAPGSPVSTAPATSPASAYPAKAELLASLPAELLRFDPWKAWGSLALSLGLSALAYGAGTLIPISPAAAPLWLLYAVVTGTVAGGCWVLAHECGHGAFHPNRRVEATVGFVLHSLLLVPYFAWQHSHAVHHAHCNHLEGGETHVPPRADSSAGRRVEALSRRLGPTLHGVVALVTHLLLGWPLYLLFGVAGGEDFGAPTSHFWQGRPFRNGRRQLFPDGLRPLMLRSNLGLVAMLLALAVAAHLFSPARVLLVYGLPYLVINAWLVTYTWLQHTDTDIPHFASGDWSWARGALQTVDRPYGPLLNLLHHGIGSTHVCHHVNPRIPHYNAWRATALLRQRFPALVRHDPTPIHRALWRVATRCSVVRQHTPGAGYFYSS